MIKKNKLKILINPGPKKLDQWKLELKQELQSSGFCEFVQEFSKSKKQKFCLTKDSQLHTKPNIIIDLSSLDNLDRYIISAICNKQNELNINLISKTPDEKKRLFSTSIETKNYSVSANKKRMLFKIKKAILLNLERFDNESLPTIIYLKKEKVRSYNFLKFVLILTRNIFSKVIDRLFFNEQWFLVFSKNNEQNLESVKEPKNLKFIIPPKDRLYADPFIIEKDGKSYVFIEEMLFSEKKGFISYFEIDEQGNYTEPKPIIKRDYHLSYPCVFKSENKYYMIPETHENNTVELYEAIDFPDKWVFKKNLLEGIQALDTTIFYHNEKFWLFLNKIDKECVSYDELHLYYSASLLGEWKPHHQNPVATDNKKARPAGRIFLDNGNIIRPGQECSLRYGYAINFNKLKNLNEKHYQEEFIFTKKPDFISRNLCLHTFNFNEKYKVFDGMKKISKF